MRNYYCLHFTLVAFVSVSEQKEAENNQLICISLIVIFNLYSLFIFEDEYRKCRNCFGVLIFSGFTNHVLKVLIVAIVSLPLFLNLKTVFSLKLNGSTWLAGYLWWRNSCGMSGLSLKIKIVLFQALGREMFQTHGDNANFYVVNNLDFFSARIKYLWIFRSFTILKWFRFLITFMYIIMFIWRVVDCCLGLTVTKGKV